ncbi:DUF445 domain-containing protein [Altericista sp. CCNU0014]|uniref:DUF445 domain-containing protein n=1 Tax=Altericista sp. CCNU0014 TaxID=3082949 RepID=UPI00384E5614
MDWSSFWIVALPPITGGIIGYYTNDLAIKMLFRPYRPIKIGNTVLPFTPGLIPRNQDRLAQRVSNAIMSSLLTPDEMQKVAQRLLQTERMQSAIQWLLELALEQIEADTQQKTVRILANILKDFVGQSLPRVTAVLARRDDFLKVQFNQIFDRILLDYHLDDDQAAQLADWLIDDAVPPDTLRLGLINFLTDRNIAILDEGLREKTSGTFWVVANLLGAKNALVRLRSFCIEERDACNARIQELVVSLGIQQRLGEWLGSLSLQNLPVSTVRQLRRNFRESVRLYLQTRGESVLQSLSDTVNWEETAAVILSRLQSSEAVVASLDVVSQELALILERYLERDLEKLVEQAIPILNLDRVIVERVKATPPESLEDAIQGIVKSELQAIVNLGGILGLGIGLFQSLLLLIR